MSAEDPAETVCYIGLGSNLDDPEFQVATAISELDAAPACRVIKHSSLYQSSPVGKLEQPDFINAVCQCGARLGPHELLAVLRSIERRHGRELSSQRRFAPRTLDLDLLLYGNRQINDADLVVPHPRMHERRFVLLPLSEIAPQLYIPGRGVVYELLQQCDLSEQVNILDNL